MIISKKIKILSLLFLCLPLFSIWGNSNGIRPNSVESGPWSYHSLIAAAGTEVQSVTMEIKIPNMLPQELIEYKLNDAALVSQGSLVCDLTKNPAAESLVITVREKEDRPLKLLGEFVQVKTKIGSNIVMILPSDS